MPSNVGTNDYRYGISNPVWASGRPRAMPLEWHDRRLRGIDDFIAAYEAEHGEITDEQMERAYRRAKARAVVVRGGHVIDDKGSGVA